MRQPYHDASRVVYHFGMPTVQNKTVVKRSIELVVPATLRELERFCETARAKNVAGGTPVGVIGVGKPDSVLLYLSIAEPTNA
jgi:hypothetical protein